MFTANPWVVYVSFLTPLLSMYYLAVGFIFYRHDLKARIYAWRSPAPQASDWQPQQIPDPQTQTSAGQDGASPAAGGQQTEVSDEPWQNEDMLIRLEELSLHLKQAIQQAHASGYSKEEFILLFQMTFKEYDTIYGTPFQLSVNHLIEAELEKYGSIRLSSEDRFRIWNQVD